MAAQAYDFLEETQSYSTEYTYAGLFSRVLSGLGALGVALQNYQAVELFLKGMTSASKYSTQYIQAAAFASGGMCSGVVNFAMNVKLLDAFIERLTSDKPYFYEQLTPWEQVEYFGGIAIFIVTGILFGLMAFTFAMTGPFATLSIASGVFVAAIMTIQEVETWLVAWDKWAKAKLEGATEEEKLTDLQLIGKWCGHIIAIGNVFALSLLFTLSLAESLMAFSIAANPAIIAGFAIAFTFGAFTEYYFYNEYLADFCKDFGDNWELMMNSPYALLGLLTISTNAFVNAALTYSALELLTVMLMTASIALPPVAMITAISVAAAFFAGSASFILGMEFWIGDKPNAPEPKPPAHAANDEASFGKSKQGFFSHVQEPVTSSLEPINDGVEDTSYACG